MKQTYLFYLLFISFFSSAQNINFPDANFKARLLAANVDNVIAEYNLIDTNLDGEIQITEAQAIYRLNISHSNISSLEGINYFTNVYHLEFNNNQVTNLNISNLSNLHHLNCDYNLLTNLNISNFINLEYLSCNNNQLTTLDTTQNINLNLLHCNSNQLTYLDVSQNINLAGLAFGVNQLTNIDVSQNSNLHQLLFYSNQISYLDISQNPNLTYLNCSSNLLTSIDVTPHINLDHLSCDNNQLSTLDLTQNINLYHLSCQDNNLTNLNLPNTSTLIAINCFNNLLSEINVTQIPNLYYFHCYNNLLTNLDVSQNVNIQYLDCEFNQITNLDVSQNTNLKYFRCFNNQLTNLDVTNNILLEQLSCDNNQLTVLKIKNGKNETSFNSNYQYLSYFSFENNPNLQYICADETQVNDIQSKIIEYGYTNCHVNSYCSFIPGGEFYTIQGEQKFDNENDACDATDNFIPNFKYSITDGTTTSSVISDTTGSYSISVQAGSHTITPIIENPSFFTISPSNIVVDFPTQTSPFTQNFCISPNGNHHDVEVAILPIGVAFAGNNTNYKIIYKNKGNQVENGIINFQFNDAILDLVSTNPAFATQATNNLSFNYSNLNPFETREISVVLNINSPMETPAVNSGDILNFTATNTITNTDEILSDNTFVLNQTVVNSFDPNDKTCLQGNTISDDKVGEYVHYLIRFENTGTFSAQNIVVKDMIDTTKFDVSSLVPLNASHNYVTRINSNKVDFIFENINLPFDNANNDGYITFKIKTLPTLVAGNTFSNSANIYFDYNYPIQTNNFETIIKEPINSSNTSNFILYPNPVEKELNIKLNSNQEINSIEIYNTIGQLVTVQTGNAIKIDVSNLKTGNYFIKINTNEGLSKSQFIKE